MAKPNRDNITAQQAALIKQMEQFEQQGFDAENLINGLPEEEMKMRLAGRLVLDFNGLCFVFL